MPRRLSLAFFLFFLCASAASAAGVSDLLAGARAEVNRRPWYQSGYYRGGYPPENVGVCTDLIWRAFRAAGIELKDRIDADIKASPAAYPRLAGKPDRNIDFRRVPNQSAFFRRHASVLGTTFNPAAPASLTHWLPGDIVVFKGPDHIAIISDKKTRKGVPYLLHNDGPWASEADDFEKWAERGIVAHYRWKWD